MKPKAPVAQQTSFLKPMLAEQCDPHQLLKQLADTPPWDTFETAFAETKSEEGRPAKPVRLLVGLLLLKQPENLSDEAAVARWSISGGESGKRGPRSSCRCPRGCTASRRRSRLWWWTRWCRRRT
ncbi:MAG: transposase [Limisphaerales bacterium]